MFLNVFCQQNLYRSMCPQSMHCVHASPFGLMISKKVQTPCYDAILTVQKVPTVKVV